MTCSAVWRFTERHFEEIIGCSCLIIIATSVFLEVILRYFFDTGLAWTSEIAGFSMVWMVYMGASLGVRERFHIRILVGVMTLPGQWPKRFVMLSDAAWIVFDGIMLWYGVIFLHTSLIRTNVSPDLGINLFWPQTIIVIGYGLMIVRLIQIYYRWYSSGAQGIPGLPDEYLPGTNEMRGLSQ